MSETPNFDRYFSAGWAWFTSLTGAEQFYFVLMVVIVLSAPFAGRTK